MIFAAFPGAKINFPSGFNYKSRHFCFTLIANGFEHQALAAMGAKETNLFIFTQFDIIFMIITIVNGAEPDNPFCSGGFDIHLNTRVVMYLMIHVHQRLVTVGAINA